MRALGFSFGGVSDDPMINLSADFYAALRPHKVFALQLAVQTSVNLREAHDIDIMQHGDVAVMLNPGVRFYPTDSLYIDLGARVAVTDAANVFTGGDVGGVASIGFQF